MEQADAHMDHILRNVIKVCTESWGAPPQCVLVSQDTEHEHWQVWDRLHQQLAYTVDKDGEVFEHVSTIINRRTVDVPNE
jgi:hypothetical protein